MIYKKVRGLNKDVKMIDISEHFIPNDIGREEAMLQADNILNDYIPTADR